MWTEFVVKAQILAKIGLTVRDTVVSLEIDFLLFDTLPESFTNTLSRQQPLPSIADCNAMMLQQFGELGAGELATLIGIEELRSAMTMQRLPDSIETRIGWRDASSIRGASTNRDPLRVDEPACHRKGDIRCPHLTGPLDRCS